MPTVPNWIGHAIVILPNRSRSRPDEAVPVKDWRATKTQVVVTLDNPKRTEIRFYLDGLRGIGEHRRAELLNAEAEVTKRRVARIRSQEAVAALETAMAINQIDHLRGNPEMLAVEIGRIQRAATAALAALADLL